MHFGIAEILLLVAAIFLLFGASRLPQLAKSLGQTRKAFKEGMREVDEEEPIESTRKKVNPASFAPQVTDVSDEELVAEMRRRAIAKQQ